MLGETRDGIAAELDDLEPDWRGSVRAVREEGRLVAAVLGDWDAELGRAWIHGPWVAGGDAELWARWSRPLVDAVLAQLPDGIDDWELAADASHVLMASLGADLGLSPSEANHVYTVEAAAVAGWPDPSGEVRPAGVADRDAVRPLHARSSRRRTPRSRRCCRTLRTGSTSWWWRRTAAASSGMPPGGCRPTARVTSTSSR
jgi:hypothetical protein